MTGEVPDDTRGALTEHLSQCGDCRALVSELARDLAADVEPASPRAFKPGELVADRYRIRGFVASGGMGEVYEAEDVELRTLVALKTVRAEIAADPKVLDRFRREINLARKVTHPNICRIFDMGFHTAGAERIAFLTMEFLEGETLADRIARGRLAAEDALPIGLQLIAGLAAAHREGVIHRDLKSANVMLVPRGAVITDFGLARGSSAGDGSATTEHRGLVGSPAYMAPEQVGGLDITAAADTYALGIVLFEMVTGSWPFIDKTPELTAFKRLQEAPPSPRSRAPELDARWDAAILRCLARAPEDRFARIDDVGTALVDPPVTAAARPRRWPLAIAIGVAAAALAVVAVVVIPAGESSMPRIPMPAMPASPSIVQTPSPPHVETPAAIAAPKPRPPARALVRPTKPADPQLDHFIMKYPK